MLLSQRFDVLVLKVRHQGEAEEIGEVLADVALPHHAILLGSASAVALTLRSRQGGTFRYVPGPLRADEVSRLIEGSISSGRWEEPSDNGGAQWEEVDLEDVIESAAATVFPQAYRRRQRFNTVVAGPATNVLGSELRLRHTLVALLRLVVSLAPRGAAISVEAEAGTDDWTIGIRAANGKARRTKEQIAEELREETKTLAAVARDVREQGGMLWVELMGEQALALCLTLPLPSEPARSALA